MRGQSGGDVVAETFAKVQETLSRGGGPEDAFRPYLLIAIRRAAYDRHRAERRQVGTGDYNLFDPDVPFADPAVAGLERSVIVRAYASLPERWQAVLWHTEIERERPAQVAVLFGLNANGVAALAYQAREGLRQAYLQMQLSGEAPPGCRPVADKLGAYIRGELSKPDAATVGGHLGQCEKCRAFLAELGDVSLAVRGIIGPLVLGAAAAGYLGPDESGGWLAGRAAWFGRAPRGQRAAVAAVAGAVVTGFAVMALAVVANTGRAPGTGPTFRERAVGAAAVGAQPQSVGQRPGPLPSQTTLLPGTTPPKPLPAMPVPAKPVPGPASPALALPSVINPPAVGSQPGWLAAAAARRATLTVRINPVGTLSTGVQGSVAFSVTNDTSTATRQINAAITLPRGVSYATAGTRGQDSLLAPGPGGWTCRPTQTGANCTHGPLAVGASTTGYLHVFVADDAVTGTPPTVRVNAGTGQVSARGTHGVVASGPRVEPARPSGSVSSGSGSAFGRLTQPDQVQPDQVQPSQVQPSQVQPSQVQPSQVQPSQVQPSQGLLGLIPLGRLLGSNP